MRFYVVFFILLSPLLSFARGEHCVHLFSKNQVINKKFDKSGWTKDRVIFLLKKLSQEGIPLNARNLETDLDRRVSLVLRSEGVEVAGNQLLVISEKLFGSWNNALLAAGFKLSQVRKQNSWNKKNIIEYIQLIWHSGYKITSKQKILENSVAINNVLSLKENSYNGLHDAGERHFGSWRNALLAAGIKTDSVAKTDKKQSQKLSPKKWLDEDTFTFLQQLQQLGVNIKSVKDVLNASQTPRLLQNIRGTEFTPKSFYEHVLKVHGSWSQALKKVMHMEIIDAHSPAFFKQALIDLQSIGVDVIHPNFANRNPQKRDARVQEYLNQKNLLSPIDARTFYGNIVKHYGSWDAALKELDIRDQKNQVHIKNGQIVWSQDLIKILIKKLYENNFPINSRNMQFDFSGELKEFLSNEGLSGNASKRLLNAAIRHFGSWDKALIAADVNPDAVRRRGTTPYYLLSEFMQKDRAANSSDWLPQKKVSKRGGDEKSEHEIVTEVTPEDIVIFHQQRQLVENAIDSLKLDKQTLFAALVREIESNGMPNLDSTELAGYFAKKLYQSNELEFSNIKDLENAIQNTFSELLSNKDLMELLN